MGNQVDIIVQLRSEIDDKNIEIEGLQLLVERLKKKRHLLTNEQTEYLITLLLRWKKTKLICFNRATCRIEKKKLAEEVGTINETLGVLRTWLT